MYQCEYIGIACLLIVLSAGWQGVQFCGLILGCLILAKIMEVK
jgi:hypothetical protein